MNSLEILEIKVALQVLKPVHEVYEAIVDPEKMSNYFISRSDGRIEQGKSIQWEFPEFEGSWTVHIDKVEQNKRIEFEWEGASGHQTRVKINLEPIEQQFTVIRISEGPMKNNQEGIKWLLSNTEGWTNFLCCLKAYVEHGINLRKGSYDFLS